MEKYSNSKQFSIENPANLFEKLNQYFGFYSFQLGKSGPDKFLFFKKGSILDGWKSNPLDWEQEIEIVLTKANTIFFKYTNHGNGQLHPHAFAFLFEKFHRNFELFLNKDLAFEESNNQAIAKAKKKNLGYFGLVLVGAAIGFGVGAVLNNFFGYKYAGIISILAGIHLARKLANIMFAEKKQLQHQT